MEQRIVLVIVVVFLILGCSIARPIITYSELSKDGDSLDIHEGIVCQHALRIKYQRDDKTIALVDFTEPVKVAQAEKDEKWGFYQFPSIGVSDDGTIRVSWQMREDSERAYGKRAERQNTPMISKDGGRSWEPQAKEYRLRNKGYHVDLSNGSRIEVSTPASKSIKQYSRFPKPVAQRESYSFYKEDSLPNDLRGVYLLYDDKRTPHYIHAKIHDPGLLRYAVDDYMPIVWWGNINELSDNSLVAGVYPTFYLDEKGRVKEGGVSFYKSKDGGENWDLLSIIPFIKDGIADVRGNKSFDEPAFEVLQDSSFICVMRSGATSPLYKTFSYDRGKTWTIPEPFTPNGVRPVLLSLSNGVLVLATGRPGIQIRFSIDGGRKWSDAIDMIPFMNTDGSFTRDVSCGYASIIDAGDNSFYLAYSDFTTKDSKGEVRKSIWFRKITIRVIAN